MTNPEYEAACLTAAQCSLRFEGEHILKQYDEIIAAAELSLDRLREARREIVNRYNLNKGCNHRYLVDSDRCPDCGELVQ